MTATVDELLVSILEAEAMLDTWDEPPSLNFILNQADGEVTFQTMDVPLHIWMAAPPHAVLTSMAQLARYLPSSLGPKSGDLIGVAIQVESWAFLANKEFTDEEKAHFNELVELMERESIAGHPEAVESKTIMALTDDGKSHMAALRRDTGQIISYGGESGQADGRVLHALGHLLEGFKEAFA